MPRRMQWRGVKKPKSLDLVLAGLDDDRPQAALRRRDRLQLSSGTADKREYEALKAMLLDLHRRVTLMPVLRALRDKRVTLRQVQEGYAAGNDALAALVDAARSELLEAQLQAYADEHPGIEEMPQRLRRMREFIAFAGGKEVVTCAMFTAERVTQFLAQLQITKKGWEGPPAVATLNNYRASLSAIATWLVARRKLAVHPIAMKAVKRVKGHKPRLPRPFRGPDFRDYVAAARAWNPIAALALQLMLHTGADVSEVIGKRKKKGEAQGVNAMVVDQIRFGDGPTGVTEIAVQRTKTGTYERLVPVPAALAALLRGHIAAARLRGEDVVFAGLSEWQIRRAHRAGRAAIKRTSLTVKDLRHVAAIRWVESGVHIRTVSKWLGHATLGQTMIYTEFEPEEREKRKLAADAAAEWLEGTNVTDIGGKREHAAPRDAGAAGAAEGRGETVA